MTSAKFWAPSPFSVSHKQSNQCNHFYWGQISPGSQPSGLSAGLISGQSDYSDTTILKFAAASAIDLSGSSSSGRGRQWRWRGTAAEDDDISAEAVQPPVEGAAGGPAQSPALPRLREDAAGRETDRQTG